jgi:hypothetical protein
MQEVIDEAFALFAPLAHKGSLSWGGELLFSDLKEQVECEEREEKEAGLWAAEESERVAKREAEEEARRVAAEAKVERLEARKAALGEARKLVLAKFHAKTLPKEELLRRNAELVAEASAIEKEEAGDGDEVKVAEETVGLGEGSQVVAGKRKADEVEGDDNGEDEVDAKRSRHVVDGLLQFVGAVSVYFGFCMTQWVLSDYI